MGLLAAALLAESCLRARQPKVLSAAGTGCTLACVQRARSAHSGARSAQRTRRAQRAVSARSALSARPPPLSREVCAWQAVLQSCNLRMKHYFKSHPELVVIDDPDDPKLKIIKAQMEPDKEMRLPQASVDASGAPPPLRRRGGIAGRVHPPRPAVRGRGSSLVRRARTPAATLARVQACCSRGPTPSSPRSTLSAPRRATLSTWMFPASPSTT